VIVGFSLLAIYHNAEGLLPALLMKILFQGFLLCDASQEHHTRHDADDLPLLPTTASAVTGYSNLVSEHGAAKGAVSSGRLALG
jgi:hypothetical protein